MAFYHSQTQCNVIKEISPLCTKASFLLVNLQDFFSDLGRGWGGGGGGGGLTGHFQSFFFSEPFFFFCFFNIFRTNSKTSKVNQQSVLNL